MKADTLIVVLVVALGFAAAGFAASANSECASKGARFVPTFMGFVCVKDVP